MSQVEFNLQAGTRYLSSEVQDILDHVFFLIPNWKWLTLFIGLIAIYFVRFSLLHIAKKIKKAQAYFREKTFMQFLFDLDIEKPLSWAASCLLGLMLIEFLDLPISLDKYLTILFKIGLSVHVIQLCYMAADAFGSSIQEWTKTTETQIDDQLAPLATKTLKVLVIIIGALVVLQNFGVNVTALLAGLGIGGVALAFAAQDTVANVFGTITILLDSPFKLGDKIKLGDVEGVVEEVGFRSTRIRTYYNSLVTLPNSVVAKEKIDNMSDRKGWARFRNTLGLTYASSPAQIEQFIENLNYQLLQDPTVDRNRISITLNNFADSSIGILVIFHFKLSDTDDELKRQEAYLKLIYSLMLNMSLEFAYPTQTMIIQNKS